MTFTWNIQKIDFFTDQVEEKGLITLESAIKEFQKFPWKEQLKKAEEREMTSTFPTITFVNDKKQSLGIWTTNLDYFEIFYINGTKSANITISHDLTLNPTGVSVEDFIELFFNGEIEDNIKLDKNENTKSSQKKISDKTQFEFALRMAKKYLPKDIDYLKPQGGLSLWLNLPDRLSASEIIEKARNEGVIICDGAPFFVRNAPNKQIRLSFATLSLTSASIS